MPRPLTSDQSAAAVSQAFCLPGYAVSSVCVCIYLILANLGNIPACQPAEYASRHISPVSYCLPAPPVSLQTHSLLSLLCCLPLSSLCFSPSRLPHPLCLRLPAHSGTQARHTVSSSSGRLPSTPSETCCAYQIEGLSSINRPISSTGIFHYSCRERKRKAEGGGATDVISRGV